MADAPDLVRAMITLAGLLAALSGGLWLVRRSGLTVGTPGRPVRRRLDVVARTAIDPKRALLLVRRDDREHLVLIAPEGLLLVEPGIRPLAGPPLPDLFAAPDERT